MPTYENSIDPRVFFLIKINNSGKYYCAIISTSPCGRYRVFFLVRSNPLSLFIAGIAQDAFLVLKQSSNKTYKTGQQTSNERKFEQLRIVQCAISRVMTLKTARIASRTISSAPSRLCD